jgi:hypothetical protein
MSSTPDNAGAFPFPTAESHPAQPQGSIRPVTETPSEPALDSGIEESFPASDPVSVSVTKAVPAAAVPPAPRNTPHSPARKPGLVRAGIMAGGVALIMGYAFARYRRTR